MLCVVSASINGVVSASINGVVSASINGVDLVLGHQSENIRAKRQ
jgi:hypothetical protein